MSAQNWFFGFEILSGIATAVVIVGLFKEYGLDVLKAFKFWGTRETHAHIEIETASKRQGSALVVLGIVVELIGTVGIVATSLRIETQHRKEVAGLNNQTQKERNDRIKLQYEIARILQGRHVVIAAAYWPLFRGEHPPVLIQNIEPDMEADELAGEIAGALDRSKTRRVDKAETHIDDSLIQDGVTIYCSGCELDDPSHATT